MQKDKALRILMQEAHMVGYGIHAFEDIGMQKAGFLRVSLERFDVAWRFYREIAETTPKAAEIDQRWPRNDGLRSSQFILAARAAYRAFAAGRGRDGEAVVAAWRRVLPRRKSKPADDSPEPVLVPKGPKSAPDNCGPSL